MPIRLHSYFIQYNMHNLLIPPFKLRTLPEHIKMPELHEGLLP